MPVLHRLGADLLSPRARSKVTIADRSDHPLEVVTAMDQNL